ncbi:MAG: UDP-glucuronic acid decarboxylase family protein [Dehalococcoidia bacterium]
MRIVVLGGVGFIGSHLADALLGQGHSVVCMDNLISGKVENVSHLSSDRSFEFIQQDVTKPIELEGPVDWVLHLASLASPADYFRRPIETLKVGSLGTLNGLGVAKRKRAKFLMTSTSEVYGDPLVSPQPEGYWGNVNPVGRRSAYDESKRFAEALTKAYHDVHDVDVRIARIFNTYGPRMRPDDGRVVPSFVNQAIRSQPLTVFGDGSQTRSFCYVSDTVTAIQKLMEVPFAEPVNIGNPDEITIVELAHKVNELVGIENLIEFCPLPEDDPKSRRPDITRAGELLGWRPMISLEEGLRRTIEWFIGNRPPG